MNIKVDYLTPNDLTAKERHVFKQWLLTQYIKQVINSKKSLQQFKKQLQY